MEKIIVLGTIGIDTLKTPFGTRDSVLGGSSIYAAYAASFFNSSGIISVKGTDLEDKELEFLKNKEVDLTGIKTQGKNFRWSGEYEFDMNEAKTLKTELNSLAEFTPTVPEEYTNAQYLFLANIDPTIQIEVIEKMQNPKIIVIDTMNFWISNKKEVLLNAIKKCNILILNEGEARQLFQTPNLIKASKQAIDLGIEAVIIKKGENGSLLFTKNEFFSCPGYPLENVIDPTGCGDTFGGSFLGHYSKYKDMRKAMVYASVMASFNAEGFGTENLRKITKEDIETRYAKIKEITKF